MIKKNDYLKFKNFFLKFIENKKNKYHPLVWINGKPKIGSNVYIGGFSEINAKGSKIRIGKDCDISSFVSINVADSHSKVLKKTKRIKKKKIIIGNNVFIGTHSAILGGTTIGSFCVIAAGTILRGENIPPYSLVLGNPAIIKKGYYKNDKT
jgi:acetyltransferase-like isoleucine patch superfamily enzyme